MFNVRCWGYRNTGQGVHGQELIIYNATMPADPTRGIICNAYNNTYFQIYSLSLSLAIVFRCQTQESHLSAVVFKKLFSDSSPFIRLSSLWVLKMWIAQKKTAWRSFLLKQCMINIYLKTVHWRPDLAFLCYGGAMLSFRISPAKKVFINVHVFLFFQRVRKVNVTLLCQENYSNMATQPMRAVHISLSWL